MKLSFRPHHFLCTLGFQGKGYAPLFVENYQKIVAALEEDENLRIEVVPLNDSICKACPHIRERGCVREPKIQRLDQKHADVLGLEAYDQITWKEAKRRLKDKMSLRAFHQACQGCSWKALGFCEEALLRLHKSTS